MPPPLVYSPPHQLAPCLAQRFRSLNQHGECFQGLHSAGHSCPRQPLPLCRSPHIVSRAAPSACRRCGPHFSRTGRVCLPCRHCCCVQVFRRVTLNSYSVAVPSGSADVLEPLKGRVFELVKQRPTRGLRCKHFSKIDHLYFKMSKCRACRSELLQNKCSNLSYFTVFVCFLQLYCQWLRL